jgi:putative nucleotidyltransferase with HDIG domain
MQKVSVENLKSGMMTYGRVRTADGSVLLGNNLSLSDSYINRLKNLGIATIFVNNPIIERIGLTYDETLSEDKRIKAMRTVKQAFQDAQNGKLLNVLSLSKVAGLLIDSIKKNQIIQLDNSVTYDDYLYLHCVNVAALAAVIANDMDYSYVRLKELVMGALLHDIGLALGETQNEQEHPEKGFDYVRKLRDYSVVSGHVVYQHHEKFDGTGYPRGLAGNDIHEYARITAIANAYDRMTSNLPGQKGMLPHEAYEAIMAMSGNYFDKTIADIFLAKAPLYPVGSFVVLDSDHVGIVTRALPKLQSRPTVSVIADADGRFYEQVVNIDLTKSLTTFIKHVMSEKEVIDFTERYKAQIS